MSTKGELPWDHLATTDKSGKRVYLYPSDVKGKWKSRRSLLSVFLVILFLGLPWIQVRGNQAILLNFSEKKFAIFGLTFWAHDLPLLFFVASGAVITVAFFTAIWGRVWCGWGCPQTVFVEQVFRRLERWIEGDALARRKLDQAPMTFNKFLIKGSKWSLYTLISLVLSHSFIAYFVGAHELGKMMGTSPSENAGTFLAMAVVAAAILFDFGWFREQFCTIVCPYGRFQSVLMDHQSTVVAYDPKRGEPRKGSSLPGEPIGDCVNCYRCVQVCPTGVDIRRGVQLECVACTACIDACDDVMERLKKPKGLIRYGTQALFEGRDSDPPPWYLRPRAWVYLVILLACASGLLFSAANRVPLELTLIRAVEAPYQILPNNLILNHFKLDLRNQTFESREIAIDIDPELKTSGVTLVVSNHKAVLAPGELERADLFVQFPKELLKTRMEIPIRLIGRPSTSKGETVTQSGEARLVGPFL